MYMRRLVFIGSVPHWPIAMLGCSKDLKELRMRQIKRCITLIYKLLLDKSKENVLKKYGPDYI